MNTRSLAVRFALSLGFLISGFAPFLGSPASAERAQVSSDLPQTFLLKLESASTMQAFRSNRSDGRGAAVSAAQRQKSVVDRRQSRVIGELPVEADVLFRTHSVLAAVGVAAPTSEKETLEAIPGVEAVYPVAPKRMTNASAVPLQAAPIAWQATGFTGQGQTIGVIDSGVDYTHSGFGGPGTVSAYENAQAGEGDPADPGLFPSSKVVGGIDLVGDDYNADSSDPGYQPVAHPDPNPLDCGGHGTHVAGSAAGYGVNSDGSTYGGVYDQSTDFDAMKIGPGMAPEAGIYAIKVFGCEGSTNVVSEAIDHAVDPNGDGDPSDRVDVINLSVGSDFGSADDGDSVSANAAVLAGVSVVSSAGNAGDVTDVSGSPGNASRVLSVASTVDALSKEDGAVVTIDGDSELFAVTRSAMYDWGAGPDLEGDVVEAPVENETACDPYAGTPFTGKVVIVKWHDAAPECGSIVRGQNLAAAGATGFIFGSDSESFSAGINGSDTIPGVLMAASGADAIRDAIDGLLPVAVDGIEVNAVTQDFPGDADKVSGFSSRGIHSAGNQKPDVAAVGSSVFSVGVGTGTEGVTESGTSMASPMVAGLAALVRQAHPAWNPLQVKADIMNTAAHDLFVGGSGDPSSDRYGPPRVGAGRIDADLATANKVLAYNPQRGSVSVSFGPVEASKPVELTREVTVDNQSGTAETLDVGYDPINEVPGVEFSVSPTQVNLGPGESTTVTVTLSIQDPSELTKAVDPTVGRFASDGESPRETLAEAFGRVLLEPTSAGPTLRVPVYAAPRPASSMAQPDALTMNRTAQTAGSASQTVDFQLAGSGLGAPGKNGVDSGDTDDDIQSRAAGFELLTTSGPAPECDSSTTIACWRFPEERAADVSHIGFTSNRALVSNPATALGFFAISVYQPWRIPSDRIELQVSIDTDGDSSPDLYLFNTRLGDDDIFVSALYDPSMPAGERIVDAQLLNGRWGDLDTALYDSDVMVLPVRLSKLASYGIVSANPRVRFGVETYSSSSNQPIDLIGIDPRNGDLQSPLSVDLFTPGLTVTDQEGVGPLVSDQPGDALTVTKRIDSYKADGGKGLMMVHFHNENGSKTDVVSLNRVPSETSVSLTDGKAVATVKATGGNLPTPGGTVDFWIDGSQVGSATLVGGSATLDRELPAGYGQVRAGYRGDADFEASYGTFARKARPTITARISGAKRNSRGWFRTPVVVKFTCVADLSPIASCSRPIRLAKDSRRLAARGTAIARDGSKATTVVRNIRIDRTPPKVRIRGPRAGATYAKPPSARCNARDRTSGVLSCRLSRKRQGGRIVYAARAEDRAGNRQTIRIAVKIRR